MKNNLLSERLVYTGESQTPTHLHLCTYNALEMQEVSGTDFQAIANALNHEEINWLQIHGASEYRAHPRNMQPLRNRLSYPSGYFECRTSHKDRRA